MAKDIIISINAGNGFVYKSAEALGINGENIGGQIIVEFFNGDFVDGAASIEIERGDEKGFIEMTKDVDTKTYRLPIKSSLLAVVGTIKMQIRIAQAKNGEEIPVFKSAVFEIVVGEAINATGTIPDEYPTWLETANAKIAEMDALMDDMEQKVESGYFNGKDGATGATGATGAQGVSVTEIKMVSNAIVGTHTVTTLRVYYSNGETDEISVYAENGKTPTVSKDPFINGQIKSQVNETIDTRNVKNKIYFVQCYDSTGNLKQFTVNGVSKSVEGNFAMVIFGKDYTNSLAIVQTGSALITELAKTTSRVTGFTPSRGNYLSWYEIDGTLEAFKGDKGDKGDKGEAGALYVGMDVVNGELILTETEKNAVAFEITDGGDLIIKL